MSLRIAVNSMQCAWLFCRLPG